MTPEEEDRLGSIGTNVDNDDEYNGMAWGSRDDIQFLVELVHKLKKKPTFCKVTTVFGFSLSQIQEMIDYWREHHYAQPTGKARRDGR